MVKAIDLTGQVFGKLTVVERDFSHTDKVWWKCRCACGNTTSVLGYRLRSGQTKSCGCSWGRPMVSIEPGTRYGNLTVIKSLGPRDVIYGGGFVTRRQFVLVKCDCGREKEVSALSLRYIKSCGCLRGKRKVSKIK